MTDILIELRADDLALKNGQKRTSHVALRKFWLC